MLLVDSVSPLSALGLEGLYGVSGFLHRAGHEPADGVFLPAHLVHDLRQRGAILPLEHRHHLRRLAARARPGTLLGLGGLLGFGRLLSRSRLPGRSTLSGRTLGPRAANVGYGFDCFAGVRRRQCDGFDFPLERGIFQGASGPSVCVLGLRYRQFDRCSLRLNRVEGSLRNRRCGLFSEALNRLPDTFGRRFPIGKLGDRLYASEAVPDFDQPLVVGPNQVGELFFSRKDAGASFASCLAGGMGGDVVVSVDGERFM